MHHAHDRTQSFAAPAFDAAHRGSQHPNVIALTTAQFPRWNPIAQQRWNFPPVPIVLSVELKQR